MLHSEAKVMQHWKGDINTPLVSICTITYNHEDFIAEAIESFLMQETCFPFEVVMDEDCSTDGTAEIIRAYVEKYPNIIKANLRDNNVGAMENSIQNMTRAKGKYIALCEGDDYWTDTSKLQIQVDKMEKYKKYKMSFHLASELSNRGNIMPSLENDSDVMLSTQDIITSDFHFVQTNTIIFHSEALKNLNLELLSRSPVGDVWIRLAASMPNGAIQINRVMGTYRVLSSGSWSQSMNEGSRFLKYVYEMIQSIDEFDRYWNYKYTKEFRIYKNKFIKAVIKKKNISGVDKKYFISRHTSDINLMNSLWNMLYSHGWVINILEITKRKFVLWYK